MNTPIRDKIFRTYRIVRQSFAKIGTGTSKNLWWELKKIKLQCWPMHNVMAALPNIGGGLCSTPQTLAHAHY